MKIRIYVIALVCALTQMTMHAADATAPAAQVVRQAAEAMKKAPSLQAAFTASSGASAINGSILLAGNRFRLTTPDLTTWFDGKTQWAYSPAAGEVNISEPTAEELMQINPFAIIAGMQTDYTPRRLKSPAGSDIIQLTPKANSEYRKIIVTFNTATKLPSEIAITTTDNSTTKISLRNISTGKKTPPASAFRFSPEKYPGVEIVDLR